MRIVPDSFSFEGMGQTPIQTTVPVAPATSSSWMDMLQKGAEVIKSGSEAYANLIRSRTKPAPQITYQQPQIPYQPVAPVSTGLSTWQWVAIIGGGTVVLGLVVYALTRK